MDCDPGVVWDAHKSVISSIFIKHSACIKERERQLELLLSKLQAELASLSNQINDLLSYRAKEALQKCRLTTYESRDKCGKILARAVRDNKNTNLHPSHQDSDQGHC